MMATGIVSCSNFSCSSHQAGMIEQNTWYVLEINWCLTLYFIFKKKNCFCFNGVRVCAIRHLWQSFD